MQIQRLIDGGLDEEQQVSLLQEIDKESPEAWRTLALGYIEAEVLRSVFEELEDVQEQMVTPFSINRRRNVRFRVAAIAALAMIFGLVLGASIQSFIPASDSKIPIAGENTFPKEAPVPPSFQAIESLDLALRDRGFEPVISRAVYKAELPDGRRLLLPVQRLSFQPE